MKTVGGKWLNSVKCLAEIREDRVCIGDVGFDKLFTTGLRVSMSRKPDVEGKMTKG